MDPTRRQLSQELHSKGRHLAARLTIAAADRAPSATSASLLKLAAKLLACVNRHGRSRAPRCKLPICPSCQRVVARTHARTLAKLLAGSPLHQLRWVRLSVVSDLDRGVRAALLTLARALGALRRRVVWRAVEGGHQHYEAAATDEGSGLSWNVHAHLVLLLVEGSELHSDELRVAWASILASAPHYTHGSVHVDRVRTLGGGR